MDQVLAESEILDRGRQPSTEPRIGILVVAYNAESTLAQVLDRVPKSFRPRITQVLVCDDASQDSTYLVGLGYQQVNADLPLKIVRHPGNLGYKHFLLFLSVHLECMGIVTPNSQTLIYYFVYHQNQ